MKKNSCNVYTICLIGDKIGLNWLNKILKYGVGCLNTSFFDDFKEEIAAIQQGGAFQSVAVQQAQQAQPSPLPNNQQQLNEAVQQEVPLEAAMPALNNAIRQPPPNPFELAQAQESDDVKDDTNEDEAVTTEIKKPPPNPFELAQAHDSDERKDDTNKDAASQYTLQSFENANQPSISQVMGNQDAVPKPQSLLNAIKSRPKISSTNNHGQKSKEEIERLKKERNIDVGKPVDPKRANLLASLQSKHKLKRISQAQKEEDKKAKEEAQQANNLVDEIQKRRQFVESSDDENDAQGIPDDESDWSD